MSMLLRSGLLLALGAAVGCGAAPGYGRSEVVTETTTTTTATTATSSNTVLQTAPQPVAANVTTTQQGNVIVHQAPTQSPVIIVPMPAPQAQQVVVQQAPTPEAVVAPPPSNAAFSCSGNERLSLVNRHVNGEGGIAVYASGNCHVIINEVILRGEPAVVAVGNARVDVIETRIYGDLIAHGAANVTTRGSRHHTGTIVRN